MRAEIEAKEYLEKWWPETLLYVERYHGAFEIFARAMSQKYFSKIKSLIAISTPADLEPLLKSYTENKRNLPRWDYSFATVDPRTLMGFDQLATKP